MNFRSTNLGRIEKSNKSAISQQNGTNSEEAQKKKKKKWRVNTLTAEGFSKAGPFMRFGNHVFRSQ